MKPCISQATTLSTPFEDDIAAFSRGGWSFVELWLTKLETFLEGHAVADVATLLADNGLKAEAAALQGGLLGGGHGEGTALHWDHFRRRLDILSELAVPTLILGSDFVGNARIDDFARAIDALGRATEEAAGRRIRLALEFQKSSRLCASLDTAVALITQVGSPHLGIALDAFHYYTGPSKFEDLAYLSPENLAWVQLSDLSGIPRELAGDSDRILPGEGDFDLTPILDHLAKIGYDGFASVEVLNPSLWEIPADRVAFAAYQALARTLGDHLEDIDRNPEEG